MIQCLSNETRTEPSSRFPREHHPRYTHQQGEINLARERVDRVMGKADTHKFPQKAWTYRIIPGTESCWRPSLAAEFLSRRIGDIA